LSKISTATPIQAPARCTECNSPPMKGQCNRSSHCYPHHTMPIGKVWIYRLLFICNFVCVCTVEDFSAEASNFARWFVGVLGRESHILGNFAPPEAQNRPANRPARALNYKQNWKEPSLACRRTCFIMPPVAVPTDGSITLSRSSLDRSIAVSVMLP